MAKHLDLEEQEQLDQIKHFWKQYGNIITWVLIVVFGSLAAWNGWQYWERRQATQAAALFEEIERAALARDAARTEQALADMKSRFASTTYAEQGALLASKTLFEAGKLDGSRAALQWVSESASDEAYQALGRLRLVGLDIEAKAYDAALKTLSQPVPPPFQPLVADRRGDVLMAQGKHAQAKEQYLNAWRTLDARTEYRRLVEVKLASLGTDVSTLPAIAEAKP